MQRGSTIGVHVSPERGRSPHRRPRQLPPAPKTSSKPEVTKTREVTPQAPKAPQEEKPTTTAKSGRQSRGSELWGRVSKVIERNLQTTMLRNVIEGTVLPGLVVTSLPSSGAEPFNCRVDQPKGVGAVLCSKTGETSRGHQGIKDCGVA